MIRTTQEEYQEDCILSKFHKLDTMIWGSICGDIKSPMVIWDRDQWGKTINGAGYYNHIITPHLYPFWCQLLSSLTMSTFNRMVLLQSAQRLI